MSSCRVFHNWGKWGGVKRVCLAYRRRSNYNYDVQEKVCKRCGKLKWRKV